MTLCHRDKKRLDIDTFRVHRISDGVAKCQLELSRSVVSSSHTYLRDLIEMTLEMYLLVLEYVLVCGYYIYGLRRVVSRTSERILRTLRKFLYLSCPKTPHIRHLREDRSFEMRTQACWRKMSTCSPVVPVMFEKGI